MNKFGMVLGLAAVATLAGCKDPDYKSDRVKHSQNEVKNVSATPAPAPVEVKPVATTPIVVEPVAKKCTCPVGMKHAEPCKCGAPDCKCIVETKPVITADLSAKPAEPEYTVYIVQNGDYLAKISKKFNLTINSIKKLNPSIKGDVILVGQKLKLPGKIDVGVQETPKVWAATKTTSASGKKAFASYTGATKAYVVKNGDTLGAIAYGNGITIRQLKELNGLTSDSLKVGQKLKIPAEKVVKAAVKPAEKVAAKPVEKAAAKSVVKAAAAPAPAKTVDAVKTADTAPAASVVESAAKADTAAVQANDASVDAASAAVEKSAAPATTTYIVQEGDDMTGVSIRWGVSAADIRELNNLGENDQLVPGQAIKLPADAQQ